MACHPVRGEQLAPALAKLAAVDVDRMLARREQVGHRRFHRAGAAGCEQDHLLARAEQRAYALARLVEHGAELGRAMVDHRTRHLQQHFGRNRCGTGRKQIFFYWVFHQHSPLPAMGGGQKKAWCPLVSGAPDPEIAQAQMRPLKRITEPPGTVKAASVAATRYSTALACATGARVENPGAPRLRIDRCRLNTKFATAR